MRNVLILVNLLAAASVLTGCDTARETLGLSRVQPDEFNVVDRKPLSVPPGYGLRPPVPGQKGQAAHDPNAEARDALLKETKQPLKKPSKTPSKAEKEMLRQARSDAKDNEIRDKLMVDHHAGKDSKKSPMFFEGTGSKKDVINPEEENLKYNGSRKPGGTPEKAGA